MTPVRLEPATLRSRVKHSTTEPLRSLHGLDKVFYPRIKYQISLSGVQEKNFYPLLQSQSLSGVQELNILSSIIVMQDQWTHLLFELLLKVLNLHIHHFLGCFMLVLVCSYVTLQLGNLFRRSAKGRNDIWAVTCDFQQCGILTCVDSDEPVQPPFKRRDSKCCSVSSLTLRIFKRLAKALIRLRICAGWSEALLVAHTTMMEISFYLTMFKIDLFTST